MKSKIRQQVYDKYRGRCAYCGEPILIHAMHVDHIHPKHLGGKDELENYNPSCRSCNIRKATHSIEVFRTELLMSHERLLRDNTTYRIANRFGYLGKTKKRIEFYFESFNNGGQTMSKTLHDISSNNTSKFFQNAEYRRANRDWINESQSIAIDLLNYIEQEDISVAELANRCGFNHEEVKLMVKGSYDFCLSQISIIKKTIKL